MRAHELIFEDDFDQDRKGVMSTVSKLDNTPAAHKLVKHIEQLMIDNGAGGRVQALMSRLKTIATSPGDVDVAKSVNKIAKIIAAIDMTPAERTEFFNHWQSDSLVNYKALISTGRNHWNDIFKGYGTVEYMTELVNDLSSVSAYGVGEGEFLLSVLCRKIVGIGAIKGEGDLVIDGKHVEVKAKRTGAARFWDRSVKPAENYSELTKKFTDLLSKFEFKVPASGINDNTLMKILQQLKGTDSKSFNEASSLTKDILQSILPTIDSSVISTLHNLLVSADSSFRSSYATVVIDNYLNVKRKEGADSLHGILFMDVKSQSFDFISQTADLSSNFVVHADTPYLITSNTAYPYPQTTIKIS